MITELQSCIGIIFSMTHPTVNIIVLIEFQPSHYVQLLFNKLKKIKTVKG